jgi:hypothetical protein
MNDAKFVKNEDPFTSIFNLRLSILLPEDEIGSIVLLNSSSFIAKVTSLLMDLPHIPEYPTQIIILNRLLCKSYLLIYGCPGGTVNDD